METVSDLWRSSLLLGFSFTFWYSHFLFLPRQLFFPSLFPAIAGRLLKKKNLDRCFCFLKILSHYTDGTETFVICLSRRGNNGKKIVIFGGKPKDQIPRRQFLLICPFCDLPKIQYIFFYSKSHKDAGHLQFTSLWAGINAVQ